MLEVRGGMKNDLTNKVIALFQGPGRTGVKHVVRAKGAAVVNFISFQLIKKDVELQINGIKLNEKEALDNGKTMLFVHKSSRGSDYQ